jgi:hypothetical protein
MELTAENVNNIFIDCLFDEGEDTSNHVEAHGVHIRVGFHPEKLKANAPKIIELLNELPDSFKKGSGDGMSFLKICDDKNGNQWTGFHKQMDELVTLGLAIKKLSYLLPREMWEAFPGGVPYLIIDE